MTPEQTMKQRRKWFKIALEEGRQIELAQVAIHAIESMSVGGFRPGMIRRLKAEQQRALVAMDKGAEKLGAPYGA